MGKTKTGSETAEEAMKVGSKGRIGSLMTRELESTKRGNSSADEESSSSKRDRNAVQKNKGKTGYAIPMLGGYGDLEERSENSSDKGGGLCIVEVVDVKCGGSTRSSDRRWKPIKNGLKKFSFSRLSSSESKV